VLVLSPPQGTLTGMNLAAIHSTAGAAYVVGLILVIACLVAAAVTAYRGVWVVALALCGVALVAAVLLL
jgi:hypothetical protein